MQKQHSQLCHLEIGHLHLGRVNLQFQGPLVPISLRPVLRIVAAYVMGIVGCHVVHFTWVFNICTAAHRVWLSILSMALEKELKVLDYA